MYVGQEATVRNMNGQTDWFKIEKGIRQGCLLSPCLFNLYAEHIMRNARIDELKARIKIGGRSIKNLRYVDDNTLMAESEKSLLMRVKESEKAGLRLNIKKMKNSDHGIWLYYCMTNRRGKYGNKWQVSSSRSPKSLWMVTAAMKSDDDYFLGRRVMTNLDNVWKSRDISLLT